MKASDLFIKALENEGVKYIFAVPGEENLDLIESIRTSSIQLVIVRHEQGAGFMAATYGRLTGKAGVCLSTLGPGATNLVTAAAYAQLGAMPMLMITGQKPIKMRKQGKFQIINVVEMMRPLTKFTTQIVDPNHIPHLVRRGFRIAEHERPGAVHLELPEDIASEQAETNIFAVSEVERPIANEAALNHAAEVIAVAKMPLLLIGAGASRKDMAASLKHFVDKTGIPFFNTQMGKGVIDERHPLYMGTAALSDGDYLHCAIKRADLIINVGHDIVEKPPFIMVADGAKVIHLNYFPAQFDEVYFPSIEVVGDIAHSIGRLNELCERQSHWDFRYFEVIKQQIEMHMADGRDDPRCPVLPQRVVDEVRQAMPDDGVLALDNGMYKIWFARNYKAHMPNTVLLDNALATMGAGLPSAIAVKLVYPQRAVVAVCGDGGFMMNSHEVETAVRLKIDLVILVLRDNAYGMIKWKQENMHLADFGLDFTNPDFVLYAQSFGAQGMRVDKAEDIAPSLRHCLQTPGVHLLEVPIDYSENTAYLGEKLACVVANL
ncbi:MAG: acetolactate synthase large subunit [Gammaproteobacteria bacterium]